MRTTTIAASRPLHWQAAFTMKTYTAETVSPIVWQHVFVSDTPMTNWCGGSSLLLTRVVKKRPTTNDPHPPGPPFDGLAPRAG
jgi:hypothetical protein